MVLVLVFPTSHSSLFPQRLSLPLADQFSIEHKLGGLRPPFFLYPQLFTWPDQLDRNVLIQSAEIPSDQRAAAFFRLGEVDRAESLLIAGLPSLAVEQQVAYLVLLAWIRLENRDLPGFQSVFEHCSATGLTYPRFVRCYLSFFWSPCPLIDSSPSEWLSLPDHQLR